MSIQIVRLTGISVDDLTDTRQPREEKPHLEAGSTKSVRTPTVFKGFGSWISRTTERCLYCDSDVKSTPLFMPLSVDDDMVFAVRGPMCSKKCVRDYIDKSSVSDDHRWTLEAILGLWERAFEGPSGRPAKPMMGLREAPRSQ